ncbi:MAG TPA: hypothetical protein PLR60_13385 [Syntrophorhabdaceae bacterium]|nr:hypothetical protein [Syntrophorhabdaceae bacterium]
MLCNKRATLRGIATLLVLFGAVFSGEASSQELKKTPIILKVSDILPRDFLKGSNYSIKDAVRSDGLVNTYELETKYGPISVESTVCLLKRINELHAIDAMERLQGTEVFGNAAQAAAMGPLNAAKDVVTDPVGTAKSMGSGIGRFISNIGQAVVSNSPYQPGVAKAALGQASNKRAFAHEFKVDPYSSYKPLQDALDKVAWTAAAGSLTVKAAFSAIPGGAGTAVSLTSTTESLRSLVRDNPPAALIEINKQKLSGMGISSGTVNAYMNNRYYNPFEQTLLVGELESMSGVRGRDSFISVALRADEESVALFVRATAQLAALFNKDVRPVERFVEVSRLVFVKTRDGRMIGIFPVDNVAWTANLAEREKEISQEIGKIKGVRGKELWFGGPIDRTARKALEVRGWKVTDRFTEKAFKELAGPR